MGNMCKGHYNYFPYFVLTISKTNWFIMTTDDQYVAKLVDRVVTNTIQLGIKKVVKSWWMWHPMVWALVDWKKKQEKSFLEKASEKKRFLSLSRGWKVMSFFIFRAYFFYLFKSGKWTFPNPPTHYIWKIPDFFLIAPVPKSFFMQTPSMILACHGKI